MANTTNTRPTPIEVWLSRTNMAINCRVVHEDETTNTLPVDALSVRGAQREITGQLISEGYAPVGRWQWTEDSDVEESVRQFRLMAGSAK